jgi:hypothetical protein
LPLVGAARLRAGRLERCFDLAPVLVVLLLDQIARGAGEPDHLLVRVGALETTAVNQDFLVELRGFEPMAIAGAARSRAIPLFVKSMPAGCSPLRSCGARRSIEKSQRNVSAEQGLAEFPCVRTALCIGRLFDGGNHSDGLAVIGEDSDLALRGGPGEL